MTERERDERDLRWLRAHVVEGLSFSEVAARHGVTRNCIAGVKTRVRVADLAGSMGMTWQDIKSAPRDGTHILVACKVADGWEYAVVACEHGQWFIDNGTGWDFLDLDPHLWMPIPPAPEGAA